MVTAVPASEHTKGILQDAANAACRGGMAGSMAMVANIATLMWLRTTVNYQYRHGTPMMQSLRALYRDGGIRRFYRGVGPVLIQGPLSRFGDTAANTGILQLLNASDSTRSLPVALKTGLASTTASLFRVLLMPIDACKINMQVSGSLHPLWKKYHRMGPRVFFQGSVASASATFAGHYPWFFTYNYLDTVVPASESTVGELTRRAGIGFSASVVSDTVSNSIRVMKVYKQSHTSTLSYPDIVQTILREQGIRGLLFRGLETKIVSNGLQGIMFSILWKQFDAMLNAKVSAD